VKGRNGDVENRLLESGIEIQKNKLMLEKKLSQGFFRPQICSKSREIASGIKKNDLGKVQNGKTEKLDFWKVIPTNMPQLTLKPSKSLKSVAKKSLTKTNKENNTPQSIKKSTKKNPNP
jgi:hypothetical protein